VIFAEKKVSKNNDGENEKVSQKAVAPDLKNEIVEIGLRSDGNQTNFI